MLKKGSTGPGVSDLQASLHALGFLHRVYDAATVEAVKAFQRSYGIKEDGICGPQTQGLIHRALEEPERTNKAKVSREIVTVPSAEVAMLKDMPEWAWARFHLVINLLTGGLWNDILAGRAKRAEGVVVKYGPGRGHWLTKAEAKKAMATGQIGRTLLGTAPGVWVVSRGPTKLGQNANVRGGWQGPTFHCSSFTNWLMGVLFDYNESYTHQGNMPALLACKKTKHALHDHPIGEGRFAKYRGYAEHCARLSPDGSSTKIHRREYLDAEEVWRRREELATINIFGQSTRQKSGKWKIEHHTGVFFMHPRFPDAVFRIAADGSRNKQGYSGTPMNIEKLTEAATLKIEESRRYVVYRLHGYPVDPRPCPIALELAP